MIERRNGRYRARYRGGDGRERSRTFDLKRDAQGWLDEQRADVARGTWVDPRHGRRLFGEWAREWQAGQLHHRETTAARTDTALRVHLLPAFGDRPLGTITRTEVQGWVKALPGAPRTVRWCYRLLATIMRAAVEDRMLPVSPCRGVKLPEVVDVPLVLPTLGQLAAVAGRLPAGYRRVVAVVAGTGLRRGEVLGLTVDRVDWLRRTVKVDRQSTGSGFAPPKRPASNRVIPVGAHTLEVLAAQVAEFPPVGDGRLFRTAAGRPVTASTWSNAWAVAAVILGDAAGSGSATAGDDYPGRAEESGPSDGYMQRSRPRGFSLHDVRHFYASLLIRQGLSPTVVAARLGHGDGGRLALQTYSHLWPDDEDRTRAAVDAMLNITHDERATGGQP